MQQRVTANPPHCLRLGSEVIMFTQISSYIYELSLSTCDVKFQSLGRIKQKSEQLWAVTYIDCQPCIPEYFDNWQQATLFLTNLRFMPNTR